MPAASRPPRRPNFRGTSAADIDRYISGLVPARPPELQRMEEIAWTEHFPIIGPAAGNFCYVVARMAGARSVFELGSGYGYSTAWFAQAVHDNGGGTVHHTEWEEELSAQARKHLEALGFADIVTYHVGEAVQALRDAAGPFDLIFNDIDKHMYPEALPVIKEKLRSGGVLIADNVLMGGSVLRPRTGGGPGQGIREFTRMIAGDRDWTASIIPIRDGLLVARRH